MLESWRDWLEHPIVTTVDTMDRPIGSIPLPAVTVCQGDKVHYDKWGFVEKLFNGVELERVPELAHFKARYFEKVWTFADGVLEEESLEVLLDGFSTAANDPNVTRNLGMAQVYADSVRMFMYCVNEKNVKLRKLEKFTKNAIFNIFGNEKIHRISFPEEIWPGIASKFDFELNDALTFDLVNCSKRSNKKCSKTLRKAVLLMRIIVETLSSKPPKAGPFLAHYSHLIEGVFDPGEAQNWPLFSFEDLSDEEAIHVHDFLTSVNLNLTGINASLIETPSILASGSVKEQKIHLTGMPIEKNFAFSVWKSDKCNYSSFWSYYSGWNNYFNGKNDSNPCHFGHECCYHFSSLISKNYPGLMKVMKYASTSNYNEGDDEIMDEMREKLHLDGGNGPELDFPMIAKCFLKGEEFLSSENDCSKFAVSATDRGICVSTNARSSDEIYKESNFTRAFKAAFRSRTHEDSSLLRYLVLDSNQLGEKRANFFLSFSENKENFDVRGDEIEILSGFFTSVKITPKVLESSPNMKDSDPNDRECLFSHERELELLTGYSHSGCLFECGLKEAEKACGCVPWNYPGSNSMMMCDLFGNRCFEDALSGFDSTLNCGHCKKDCEKVIYAVHQSSYPLADVQEFCLTDKFGVRSLTDKKNAYVKSIYPELYHRGGLDCSDVVVNDLAVVKIEFGGRTAQVLYQDVSNTIQVRVAVIGGTLSLFTGMSIIGLIEFAAFLISVLLKAVKLR